MRIAAIQITNLAAFDDFKADFPAVCLITGKHGSGKSSLEQVIMYMMGRRPLAAKGSKSIQHDPSILHGAAESGEAIISFSEDAPAEFLRVRVKPDSTERKVKMRGRKSWEDAGSFVEDITNALAYDPMQFRDLGEKDRLEAFLRAAPIEITQDEVVAATHGSGEKLLVSAIPAKPGLDTINRLYDEIYRMRTAENGSADTQAKYASQLEEALPKAPAEGDWNAEATRLRSELTVLDSSEAEEIKRIGKEFQGKKDKAGAARRDAEATIDTEVSDKVAALEVQVRELQRQQYSIKEDGQTRKSALGTVEADANEAARVAANSDAKEIKDANAPLRATLTTNIATADERARAIAQAEGTRQAAATARKEADAYRAKSKLMTEALERLTALKATVGGRMSVKGVTIASPREGMPVDICREEDGALVPFPRWNDAAKDQFCLKMAILFRGPFGLVCIDNMGNFSPARRESVISSCRKYAAEKGMQFLLGIANDDGDLKIKDATQE